VAAPLRLGGGQETTNANENADAVPDTNDANVLAGNTVNRPVSNPGRTNPTSSGSDNNFGVTVHRGGVDGRPTGTSGGRTVCTQDPGVALYASLTSSVLKAVPLVNTPLRLWDDSGVMWQVQECGRPEVWFVHYSTVRLCSAPCASGAAPAAVQSAQRMVCMGGSSYLLMDDTDPRSWLVRKCGSSSSTPFYVDSGVVTGCSGQCD